MNDSNLPVDSVQDSLGLVDSLHQFPAKPDSIGDLFGYVDTITTNITTYASNDISLKILGILIITIIIHILLHQCRKQYFIKPNIFKDGIDQPITSQTESGFIVYLGHIYVEHPFLSVIVLILLFVVSFISITGSTIGIVGLILTSIGAYYSKKADIQSGKAYREANIIVKSAVYFSDSFDIFVGKVESALRDKANVEKLDIKFMANLPAFGSVTEENREFMVRFLELLHEHKDWTLNITFPKMDYIREWLIDVKTITHRNEKFKKFKEIVNEIDNIIDFQRDIINKLLDSNQVVVSIWDPNKLGFLNSEAGIPFQYLLTEEVYDSPKREAHVLYSGTSFYRQSFGLIKMNSNMGQLIKIAKGFRHFREDVSTYFNVYQAINDNIDSYNNRADFERSIYHDKKLSNPRILLIQPDINRLTIPTDQMPSHTLNQLASYMRMFGIESFILDSLKIGEMSNFLAGYDINAIINDILMNNRNIKIVALSSTIQTLKQCIEIAKYIKTNYKDLILIIGGPGVSFYSIEILKTQNEFDYVCYGEGEETLKEIIQKHIKNQLVDNIENVAYRDNNGDFVKSMIKHVRPSLDDLPYPDYTHYEKIPKSACIITSRGCKFNCTFCSSHNLWKNPRNNSPIRQRDEFHILEEIKYLHGKPYEINEFHFHDDCFGSTDTSQRLMKQIVSDQSLKNVKFYAHTRFETFLDHSNHILFDRIELMNEANINNIMLGLESGSDTMRLSMNKGKISNYIIKEVLRAFAKVDCKVGLFLIFGFPGEKISDVQKTWQFLQDLKSEKLFSDVYCSLFKYQPGSIEWNNMNLTINTWINKTNGINLDFLPTAEVIANLELYQGLITLFNDTFKSVHPIRNEYETNTDIQLFLQKPEEERKKIVDHAAQHFKIN